MADCMTNKQIKCKVDFFGWAVEIFGYANFFFWFLLLLFLACFVLQLQKLISACKWFFPIEVRESLVWISDSIVKCEFCTCPALMSVSKFALIWFSFVCVIQIVGNFPICNFNIQITSWCLKDLKLLASFLKENRFEEFSMEKTDELQTIEFKIIKYRFN